MVELTEITNNTSLQSVWVVIPARNEEASLPLVLDDLPKVGRVIVVDNGSTDSTAQVARDLGACAVREPVAGYGRACLAGLEEVRRAVMTGDQEPAIIAFLDADYSDHPDMLESLVQPLLDGTCDFILGSRMLGEREPGAMPPQAVYGNKLACWLMHRIWKTDYTDLGPFRAITYPALRQLQMQDRNFGWTVEMQVKARVAGLRVREIPVPYRRRIGTSKISGTITGTVRAGWKILWTIGRYAVISPRSVRRDS